jgi:hypothetical protein
MDRASPGKYNLHYGLTVPNLWSSTPWLTMNNERLNAFKIKCVSRAIATVNEIRSTPGGQLLQSIVTDDEPIYWICNPGPAERWQQFFSAIGNWNVSERRLERALSVMVQEAAIKEWQQASFH